MRERAKAAVNKREIGSAGEDVACRFLEEKGMRIIERNFRCRSGEIDVIAAEKDVLVFVEVKLRRSMEERLAFEAVHSAKQKKIIKSALVYMMQNKVPSDKPCRFDVIGIAGKKLYHIRDAFGIH